LDAIRGKVYIACLDADMTSEEVFYILREFISVGLLRVWKEDNKVWGYFNGIEKSGRLPGEASLKRNKHLPPSPPIEDAPLDEMFAIINPLFPKGCTMVPRPPQNFTDTQ
jgi:hypothetical protein